MRPLVTSFNAYNPPPSEEVQPARVEVRALAWSRPLVNRAAVHGEAPLPTRISTNSLTPSSSRRAPTPRVGEQNRSRGREPVEATHTSAESSREAAKGRTHPRKPTSDSPEASAPRKSSEKAKMCLLLWFSCSLCPLAGTIEAVNQDPSHQHLPTEPQLSKMKAEGARLAPLLFPAKVVLQRGL